MKVSRARQCKALTRAGGRCSGWAIGGGDFCFTHSPQASEARQVARLKGGYNRRTAARVSGDTPIAIASMADVLKLINVVVADSWQLENSPARSRCLLACASTAIEALEIEELEARIMRLENHVNS